MIKNHLDLLHCVTCKGEELTLHPSIDCNSDIQDGLIICSVCSTKYPIISGIPCFLKEELWDDRMKQAIQEYSNKEGTLNVC